MRIKVSLLAVAAFGLLTVFSAQGAVSKFTIKTYTDYKTSFSAQGKSGTANATALSVDLTGGAALPGAQLDPFVSFSLDINTGIQNGWWKSGSYENVPVKPARGSGSPVQRQEDSLYRVANLYQHYAPGILDSTSGKWLNKLDGAALQLAIWEVLYEPYKKDVAYNVLTESSSKKGFKATKVNNAVAKRANEMLANYSSADFDLDMTFWGSVTDAKGKVVRSGQYLVGPFTPVPEASTYIAALLLCIPVAVNGIRILRKRGQ